MGLAEVIDNGAVPGLTTRLAMLRTLELQEKETFDLLRSNKSGRDALLAAFRQMSNPPRERKVAELAQEVQARVETARVDTVLNEAVARFRHVDDPIVGNWFRIRNELESRLDSGDVKAEPRKLKAMRNALAKWKMERATIARRWAEQGSSVTARMWEAAFYDYTRKAPDMAALWGFAVISLDSTLNYEKYYPELTESRFNSFVQKRLPAVEADVVVKLGRPLTASEKQYLVRKINKEGESFRTEIAKAVREHGPIPELGYRGYVEANGFGKDSDVKSYFSSPAVRKGVDNMCPNT